MKYTEIELQCEDLLWFGLDTNDNIIAFTSGGIGCIPDFVCNNKKNTQQLQKYFNKIINKSGKHKFAENGLYYYDVSYDNNGDSYTKVESPSNPLTATSLPEEIYSLIKNNIINYDAKTSDKIIIKHAY